MGKITSTIAALQIAALFRGPAAGSPGPQSARPVFSYQDTAVASGTVLSTEYIRFGSLPAGAQILPHLSWITSGHSATIAGKITLTPLDGSAGQDIAGVTITRDASSPGPSFATAMSNQVVMPVLTKPCYVDFVPTADTTFSGNVTCNARLAFSLNH